MIKIKIPSNAVYQTVIDFFCEHVGSRLIIKNTHNWNMKILSPQMHCAKKGQRQIDLLKKFLGNNIEHKKRWKFHSLRDIWCFYASFILCSWRHKCMESQIFKKFLFFQTFLRSGKLPHFACCCFSQILFWELNFSIGLRSGLQGYHSIP